MITEQQILDFMRETAYKPMTYQELEQHFELPDAASFKQLLKTLNQLEQDGYILRSRTDRYGVPERMNLVRGRLQAHAKGFAFLIPDEAGHPDVYVHANDLKTAMNGDTVLVRITSRGNEGARLEGEVVRVVTRAIEQVVGVFQNMESYGFVVADDRRINRDIFIPKGAFHGAVTGQKVVVRIVNYPEGRAAAEGEVIEILGHKDDPGVDILSIIRKHQLPEAFPDEVMREAEASPDEISESEITSQKRRDLRGLNIVTIDGEDAKDLDDAVYVEKLPNGHYKLGVHIADVGYYVKEGSALDREAYARGCSVYLVDRVIPMLPHRLSNGICSLHPRVDRLTLSCEMEFDEKAKLVKHDIFSSVIRTVERMTYTDVRKIVEDEDPEVSARYAYLVDSFKLMKELALKLRAKRMKRGAIDFDFEESKVIVDEEGKPVDIIKRERSIAEQIIEEFMLASNETVAEHFHWLRVPFLYRIHEEPSSEKLMNFVTFAANFGHVVRGTGNSVHPRALQLLLEEIQGSREQTVLSTMMLRSMKQAKYDAEVTGHFGLAADFYSHFTSPIRRYPDLVIHRVIREVIDNNGVLQEKRNEQLQARMPDIAKQSSERERIAVDAERDTVQLKKAEFMVDKVGEEYDGIISSVTSFGMFIELENTVEGLIRLSDMVDDYYHFHEQYMMLLGERTSNMFRIGDAVRIRVGRVNMDDHTIDFELVSAAPRHGTLDGKEFAFELRKKQGRGEQRGGRGGRGRDDSRNGGRGGRAAGSNDGRGGAGRDDRRGGQGERGGRNGGAGAAGRGGRNGAAGDARHGAGSRSGVRDAGRADATRYGKAGESHSEEPRETEQVNRDSEEWLNAGEYRSRYGGGGAGAGAGGRGKRGRRGPGDDASPYAKPRSGGNGGGAGTNPPKGKGGIRTGSAPGGDEANWVDRLISEAENDVERRPRSFEFGSGKGGYGYNGAPGSGNGRSGSGGRKGGGSYGRGHGNGPTGAGKRGRKSTSESGVFIGEQAAGARDHAKQAEGEARRKGKSKNNTAKFVRKKR